MTSLVPRPDLVCLSHLRWGCADQRPQQLMARFGRRGRVFFSEEPLLGESANPRLEMKAASDGVFVVQPMLPAGLEPEALDIVQGILLNAMLHEMDVRSYVLWFYNPLAVRFTQYFNPAAVVYDCMDELAGFADVSAEWLSRERELLARSDLVFTGGQSSHQARRWPHARVHEFPNGGDADARARGTSWDETCEAMDALLDQVLTDKAALRPRPGRRTRQVAAATELH